MHTLDKPYELPWRPAYEKISAFGWLTGALLSALIWDSADLPPAPFALATGLCGTMFVLRGARALRQHRRVARLKDTRALKITRKALHKIVKANAGVVWLGRGFNWRAEHAQLAHEVRQSGIESKLKSAKDERDPFKAGSHWMHGLDHEHAVEASLEILAGQTLIVGTTGAGKTRAFETLITQAIMRGEPVIVIDPKGDKDLCETMRKTYEYMGQPEKFNYFHPAHPEKSVRIDPLHNWNRPTEIASRIAAIIASEGSMDPFVAFGWNVMNDVAHGLLHVDARPNLISIQQYVQGGVDSLVGEALRRFLDEYDPGWVSTVGANFNDDGRRKANETTKIVTYYKQRTSGVKPAIRPSHELNGLVGSYEHNREHFQKMIATLIPTLSMLTSGDLGLLLSPHPDPEDPRPITNMTKIINGCEGAYIGLDSLADSTVASAIGSILMADLTAVAADRYNYGVSDVGINVYLDEAAEVINQPTIMLLNKGRGGKFRLTIATQTFADFGARLGSEAKARQVLGNT
ncbi:MAG: conjugative transfer system coupling protein TraD, partial [Sinobacteraceae bacterium]|nr:conjugative transfer system coupling protein TraD [Nevskiaceae bacterium]